MEIETILKHCEALLDSAPVQFEPGAAPRLEISLVWRVRLWAAMNQSFPSDSLLRRSALAYSVARRAAQEWEAVKNRVTPSMRDLPSQLLTICLKAARGELTERQAHQQYKIDQVEAAMGLEEEIGLPAFAPLAAHAAIKCAVGYEDAIYREWFYARVWDDDFEFTCDESRDWLGWDAHFWASCAAGGFPSLSGYNQQLRWDFWRRWLRKDVPAVLGDTRIIRTILEQ